MITEPLLPAYVIIPILLVFAVLIGAFIVRRKQKIGYKILDGARILLILLLVFAINMRPMNRRYNVDVELKNIDVLFVTDTTISMWAQDVRNGTRMSAVISDCNYIMEELSGSNFGLIRFDNRAQVLAPFTQDTENVKDAFSTINEPDRYYARGSSLNVPYSEMETMLLSSDAKKKRMTVVFFITDGEITDDSTLQSYKELAQYVDGGAVLGYGTDKGGTMLDRYGSYIRDPQTYDNAVSKIDEKNLRQLAEDLDVEYIHMEDESNIAYMIDAIKTGSSLSMDNSDMVSYEEVYYYFAIPLAALLLWELFVCIRRGRL